MRTLKSTEQEGVALEGRVSGESKTLLAALGLCHDMGNGGCGESEIRLFKARPSGTETAEHRTLWTHLPGNVKARGEC